ncbi:MAG: carbohydrate ABC transporter permease [Thermomicrobiales bacterium]
MQQSMQGTASHRQRNQILWRRWRGVPYVVPWCIGFLVFTLGPYIYSFYLSFSEWSLLGPIKFVGPANYQKLFNDPVFIKSLVNTTLYTIVSVPGVMCLAFCAALLLNEEIRLRPLFRTVFYLPSITPGVASVILWVWLLQPTGIVNTFLGYLGVPPDAQPSWFASTQWALPGLILMSFWGIGSMMIIYLAGLQGVPQHLYEAAQIDGANWWQQLRNVTIPMMTPTIFFTMIVGVIGSFQSFTSALIATEGGPANATLFVLLYLYYQGFRFFHMGYASAIAWVLFVIVMAFTLLQFALARRWVHYDG